MLAVSLVATAGCAFNTHGNRKDAPRLLSRVAEVRGAVGKRVTLVGTARMDKEFGASIDLRGGRVELPEYEWPSQYVDRPASITGLLLEPRMSGPGRVYRLGEIERADQWSR